MTSPEWIGNVAEALHRLIDRSEACAARLLARLPPRRSNLPRRPRIRGEAADGGAEVEAI